MKRPINFGIERLLCVLMLIGIGTILILDELWMWGSVLIIFGVVIASLPSFGARATNR